MRRRDFLVLGCVVAVPVAVPPYLRSRVPDFAFEPLDGFDGFRRLNRGPITGGFDVFAGISPPAEPHQAPTGPLCETLFGAREWANDALPIAVFGDVNCPNCLAFDARLKRLEDSGAGIRLTHHQLPLLGPDSVRAARVILAAGLQDPDNAVYADLLVHVLRPGPAGTRDVADRHGLNGDRLWQDAQSAQVADLLGKALGLGAALGIPGTPSSVVGRTLVMGAIPERDLNALIELEKSQPFAGC